MNIHNVIVHSIEKEQHETEKTKVQLKDEELTIDSRLKNLMLNVQEIYNDKTGKSWGKLISDQSFPHMLGRMLDNELSFIDLSKRAMPLLKVQMDQQPLSTGGYILFIYMTSKGKRFFMVVMLKSKKGMTFNETLELLETDHLDTDKLHFAARINIDEWQNDNEHQHSYVSFVKGRSSGKVTSYFRAFLGIDEFIDAIKSTGHLITAINGYCKEQLELTGSQLEDYKKNVHEYCKTKHQSGQTVYLDELSAYLDGDEPHKFMKYAHENHKLSNEISIDINKLRKLVKYSGQDSEVSIKFGSETLGKRVKYDKEKDILTIYRVPQDLRKQLNESSK